jgi:hypothetical protein
MWFDGGSESFNAMKMEFADFSKMLVSLSSSMGSYPRRVESTGFPCHHCEVLLQLVDFFT